MENICKHCSAVFIITKDDLDFYDRVSPLLAGKKYAVPPPTLCPDCRSQRRMAFRCERSFHSRHCDNCRKHVISIHPKDTLYPVYCGSCWWGDTWDGITEAREIDFSRPFFEQFRVLQSQVPTINMVVSQGENSEYSSYCSRVKNCYLLIAGDQTEDCMYGSYVWLSRNCIDCMNVIKCEQCFECIECQECYHCLYCQRLRSSTNCYFGFDLASCKDCFGCVGLRNKQYCWFNEQLTKNQYMQKLADIKLTHSFCDQVRMERESIRLKHPHKYAQIINCVDCTGDSVSNSKNAIECYDSFGVEDGKFLVNGPDEIKDCYDFTGLTVTQLSYEGVSIHGGNRLLFSERCWNFNSSVMYCSQCMSCSDCFGCYGLKNKKYCILNKQYSKQEYEALVPKLIAHMQTTGEWGEFFPMSLSVFPYNETIAQEYYPLQETEVRKMGITWKEGKDPVEPNVQVIAATKLPATIADVPNIILQYAIACKATGRLFKIVKQELEFYRSNNLPIPRYHPDYRHMQRMALRNPHKLWERECDKCAKKIQTTFAPKRPEIVYCEDCYRKEVY